MTEAPEAFNSAPPAAPAGRGQTEDRADGVERDWLGRYILPQLDGTVGPTSKQGTAYGMTRVSTVKSAIASKDGIRRWREQTIGIGLVAAPALMADLMRAVAAEDKKAISAVLERAFESGGGKEKADRGTKMHETTERIKRGEAVDVNEVPADHQRDVRAYLQLLDQLNIRPVAGMQERIVKCPYGAAGTFDDMVNWFNPETEEWELVIADLKTGRDLSLGWLEILMQLWFYANAEAIWNPPVDGKQGYYSPLPTSLRNDRALVFHTPMNGTAELFVLDLSGVRSYVEAAVMARRANAEAKFKVRSAGFVDLRDAPFVTSAEPPAEFVEYLDTTGPAVPGRPTPVVTFPGQVTPQMLADAQKADERRAAAGITIDGVQPTKFVEFSTAPLNGEGKPLAPLAEKGKKGCSVCRRTGHRKGSPACLGLDDPALDNPNALNGPIEPPVDPAEDQVYGVMGNPIAPEDVVRFHNDADHQAPGWTPGPEPEQWVCATCGLPSELAEQQRLNRQSSQPLNMATLPVLETAPPGVAYTLPGPAGPLDLIAQAQTSADVIAVVQTLQAKGWWSAEIDAAAQARYHAVQFAGWPK